MSRGEATEDFWCIFKYFYGFNIFEMAPRNPLQWFAGGRIVLCDWVIAPQAIKFERKHIER